MTLTPYTKAWSLAQEGLTPKPPAPARTFLRSPAFPNPARARQWLIDQGCDPNTWKVERGPDGLVRGSGEVIRG